MIGKLILLIVPCLSIVRTSNKNLESPCPKLFKYDTDNEKEHGRWYGNVTLLSNKTLDGVWLRLLFNSPPLHVEFQNQFGEINAYNSINYIIKHVDYELKANTPLMLRFYVQYDTSKPVPLLIGIRLNAETICDIENEDNHSDPIVNNVRDDITTVSKECPLQDDSPLYGTFPRTNDICGRPSQKKPEALALEENSAEGKWPWIAAIYQNLLQSLRYKCGGSLISQNLIATSASCVEIKATGDALLPTKILAFLGTTSLGDYSDGHQIATISRVIIHPQYTPENFDNNIAILKTKKPVEYTYFVKPVCLWDEENNISRLYGKKGNAISWTYTQNGKFSKTIEHEVVIIDNISCGDANPEDFKKLIHTRGFCAGAQNGSRGFDVHTGSGLVVKESNVNGEEIWYLIGLSSSCPRNTEGRCDQNYYLFYLGIAKYVPWIKKIKKYI